MVILLVVIRKEQYFIKRSIPLVLFIKMKFILRHIIQFVYYMDIAKILEYESLSLQCLSSELGLLLILPVQEGGFCKTLLRRKAPCVSLHHVRLT